MSRGGWVAHPLIVVGMSAYSRGLPGRKTTDIDTDKEAENI